MSQEVVQVVGTGDDGIWVEGVQQSACGACSARAGCGQHTLSKMGKPVRLWVRTNDSFKVGDQVTIMLPSGSLAISALAMYGLPLLGLILGAVIGFQGGSEPQSLLAGGLGLILGLLAARQLGRKMQSEWQPTVLKKTHSTAININGVSE